MLEKHGLELELTMRGSDRSWRLTAARGERIVVPDDGSVVPPQIESLLRTVVHGRELVAVPVRSSDPEIRRLEDHVARQRDSLVRHDVGARIGSDPESLHQVRVAARRVRAFVGVAQDLVDAEWAAEINDGMRGVGRASNEARDLDVLLDKLRAEIRSIDLRDRAAAEALIERLESDRSELQCALVEALDSDRYQGTLERLGQPVVPADGTPKRTLEKLAGRELNRLVAWVKRLGKRPSDDALHALRIKVKRLRYATELAGAASGKPTRRVIEAGDADAGSPRRSSGRRRRRASTCGRLGMRSTRRASPSSPGSSPSAKKSLKVRSMIASRRRGKICASLRTNCLADGTARSATLAMSSRP